MYDVIVIGSGPSGLMAGIAAAEQGSRVLIIEKGNRPGNKLAISGGGRCNVTNRLPQAEIIKNIPGNGRFLYGALAVFDNEDIITFFENLGVALKEEDHGRMFPISNKSTDVVNALLKELKSLGAELKLNTEVAKLLIDDEKVLGVRLSSGKEIRSHKVILAVGGKAVPQTGSTGDGYPWAERAGHTVTDLYPTEVPLLSKEDFIKSRELQGLSLRDVGLSVLNQRGKKIITHQMDMLFTHFGLSGPAVLRSSQFVVKEQKKLKGGPVPVLIDTIPSKSEEQLFQKVQGLLKAEPNRQVNNVLKQLAPERWINFLLERADITTSETFATLANAKLRQLVGLLKEFRLEISGTQGLDKAFVTGGGVKVSEIDPRSMESKLKAGLYFCGEIIDIHGYTGGYNITAALVTGRVAGLSAGGD